MKKFPILKIPDVAFREVTSMMTPTEIIKLAMSNFKLELLLRNRKYKIDAIILQSGNNYPQIDTESAENCLSVFFEKSENEKRYPVTQLVQLQDKYREEIDEKLYLTHLSLEEMSSIYSNLTRLFSCSWYIWVLIFDEMKLEEFWEYTEKILTFEFRRLTVHGGSMSNDVLAKLMDKAPEKAELSIDSDIPLDYSHPKALQFHSVDYEEARWLKSEDLYNIRNSYTIKLERTNFDSIDVNRFLNYWSDCDKDMMEEISISLKEGTQINKQEIFRNLIVISPNDDDSVILIMKLSMSDYHLELMLRNRKCKINAVIVQTGNIYSQIDTKSARDCLSVFFKKSENDKRNPVTQLVQLQDKYREEIDEKLFLTYVSLDEMFSIYSNLTLLFSCPFHKWVLVLDGMNLEEFWQYTERILKLKFQRFAVHAKTMSNVVLTELMDKIPEKMEVIIDSDIPLDYSHPKALRFRSFKYTEARWLKIEDFFNIRNLCLIKLDRTNFDCSDVIKFLNYWSDCDEDMMEGIAMGLKEGTQIDEEEIIKIFIVISDNESSHSRFFM
ncbi:hypothetical protein B9Z55_004497 [Caenorhabditis nigoni]|nr:hypothetical protein B9Z55_004497 [Caenorhabditis nigoni]